MVTTYEALIILKPILDVDNSDNVLKTIEELIANLGGSIVKKDKIGRKRLAYEILKFKDGFVASYVVTLPPNKVEELRHACKMNEDVLRLSVINRNGLDMTDNTIYGRERPGGDRESRRPARFAGA